MPLTDKNRLRKANKVALRYPGAAMAVSYVESFVDDKWWGEVREKCRELDDGPEMVLTILRGYVCQGSALLLKKIGPTESDALLVAADHPGFAKYVSAKLGMA